MSLLSFTTFIRQSAAIRRLISSGLSSTKSGKMVSFKTHSLCGKWSASCLLIQIAKRNHSIMRNSPRTCTPTSHRQSIKHVSTLVNATITWLWMSKNRKIIRKRTRTSVSLNRTFSDTSRAKTPSFQVSKMMKKFRSVIMRSLSWVFNIWNSASTSAREYKKEMICLKRLLNNTHRFKWKMFIWL